MGAINGIYLPGWEYNRMLANSPFESRNSALPGAVFWNGAAPLWMFEKVYCTKESLDNEMFAAQEIGWATSRIFGQLAAGFHDCGPVLEPVEWMTVGDGPRALVSQIHKDFREKNSDRQIRDWIDQANDPELERINYAILQPIAASKQSIVAGAMSGLRHWLSPAAASPASGVTRRQEQLQKFLSLISDPISGVESRNGIKLVRHPREWDPTALDRQNEAKAKVETPFIRDLQAGEGDFAGGRGYEPYILNVATERPAYQDVDTPLLADWEQNYTRLLRLRDVASTHLWPKLHGDWLPALLREEPEALADFPRYVKAALISRPFANLLNLNTRQVFTVIAGGLGATALWAPAIQLIAATFGVGSGVVAALIGERPIAQNVGPLAVFYQEAFRALRG